MRTKIPSLFASFAVALIAGAAARIEAPSTPEQISRLDDCIQRRFLDTGAFGMRRILPNAFHGVRQFQPENNAERAVVDQLQRKGYEVALFLAGRNILADPSPLSDPRRFRVQGPALITPAGKGEFPAPGTLLADARRALLAFEKGSGYDLGKQGWTVSMRPLRATGETCVQCHLAGIGSAGIANTNLKIGDPLGVAMYVYRRAAPID